MSETDIYKNREALPIGNKPPRKKNHRRSGPKRAFDDHSRKRRSKNSGARRALHLARKSENEKVVWISVGIIFLIALIAAAVWQFLIREIMIRDEQQLNPPAVVQAAEPAENTSR